MKNSVHAKPTISVIIPVFKEENAINAALFKLLNLTKPPDEIIVVDGDPTQSTHNAIFYNTIKKITSKKGRAVQMNAGAENATGDILLFLHADTALPPKGLQLIKEKFSASDKIVGAFDLKIKSDNPLLKLIGVLATLRSRLTGIPYGDQAIFVNRSVFKSIEGFPDQPLMEDIQFMKNLKRINTPIAFLTPPASTSARRWEKEGILKCTLRNRLISILYFFGVSPDTLKNYYV